MHDKNPDTPDQRRAKDIAELSVEHQLHLACTLLAHWYAGGMLTWHSVSPTFREGIYQRTRALLQAQEVVDRGNH